MNRFAAHLLTRLYPRAWRERYGAEFEAFLQTGRGGLLASANVGANVVWSALCERIFPTRGGTMDQDPDSFQSWCVRAPWAIFGLAPLLLLAGAWLVALLMLWFGWNIFLPGADTPFGSHPGAYGKYDLANLYFQLDRLIYFGAPILVGWGIGLIAARQRLKAVWPTAGLVLTALIGGTAQVHAGRTAVPGGLGHISMDFTLGSTIPLFPDGLSHALAILSLTALPYLLWRFQKTRRAARA